MRAILTNPNQSPRLIVGEGLKPTPEPDEVLVKVAAFSLNAGEVRAASAAVSSYTPGWDFAGVVEQPATTAGSPALGARVFGLASKGAWAEYLCISPDALALIPDTVTFAQAASLPVAGMTALACLDLAGSLLGKRVLIGGGAGGVGRFACQLAALGGGRVFAVSRRDELPGQLLADGVQAAAVFKDMAEAKAAGSYDVILDSVGGESLALALTAVASGGVVVNCGNSSHQKTTFDVRDFYLRGDVTFHGVFLATAWGNGNAPALRRLVDLVASGELRTPIAEESHWSDIDAAAQRLTSQAINGKIVLTIA